MFFSYLNLFSPYTESQHGPPLTKSALYSAKTQLKIIHSQLFYQNKSIQSKYIVTYHWFDQIVACKSILTVSEHVKLMFSLHFWNKRVCFHCTIFRIENIQNTFIIWAHSREWYWSDINICCCLSIFHCKLTTLMLIEMKHITWSCPVSLLDLYKKWKVLKTKDEWTDVQYVRPTH